jgi:hypothetical protein
MGKEKLMEKEKLMSRVYITPQCGREDREGPTLGPFDYVQMRYTELIDQDNNTILFRSLGDWYIFGDNLTPYSDIVIYSAEDKP